MTLTIQFTPKEEALLAAAAQEQGLQPDEVIRKLVHDLPSNSIHNSVILPPTGRAVAYLRQRIESERTSDPNALRQAQEELDEMKQNMNAERQRSGAEPVF